jgi:hypothetical protein
MIYVTVHPGSVAPAILKTIETVVVVGDRPDVALLDLCRAGELKTPAIRAKGQLSPGSALYWKVRDPDTMVIRVDPPKHERTRHSRKYAEGNLGNARSFYFRGREGKLNLRAQNLMLFVQMSDGVDDDTWQHHREQGDYSRWFRDEVKDEQLATEAEAIEGSDMTAADGRAAIRAAVEKRYTIPADQAVGDVA